MWAVNVLPGESRKSVAVVRVQDGPDRLGAVSARRGRNRRNDARRHLAVGWRRMAEVAGNWTGPAYLARDGVVRRPGCASHVRRCVGGTDYGARAAAVATCSKELAKKSRHMRVSRLRFADQYTCPTDGPPPDAGGHGSETARRTSTLPSACAHHGRTLGDDYPEGGQRVLHAVIPTVFTN